MNRPIALETSDQGSSRISTWADQLAHGFVFKRLSYVGWAPEVEDTGLAASHGEWPLAAAWAVVRWVTIATVLV
jgi:hypothetical protein